MAMKKVGYSMPSSMAGIMSAGKSEIGGIPIDPKMLLIAVLIFILLINVVNIVLTYFFGTGV